MLALSNVLGIALGVAVFVSIQIANRSSERAFRAGVDVVAGRAHLEVSAPTGLLDETLFPKLAAAEGVIAATPILEKLVTLPGQTGEYLRLLGIDVFSNRPFSTFKIGGGSVGDFDIDAWLTRENGVAITPAFAERNQLKVGDAFYVLLNQHTIRLEVLAVLDLQENQSVADSRIAVMDLAWLQALAGEGGRLSSMQLRVDSPEDAVAVGERLEANLENVSIRPPARRSEQVERMLSGFRLNLTALSMVSLLVGMFLIYNSASASVVRRREELGTMRAMGVTRNEVLMLVLAEALFYGLIGAAIGIPAGRMLAAGLTGAVSTTISSLYVLVSIEQTWMPWWLTLSALILALLSCLLAAWIPALEAANTDPVKALNPGNRADAAPFQNRRFAAAGVGLLLLAGLSAWLALAGWRWCGFACAFFVMTGFACWSGTAALVGGAMATTLTRWFRGLLPGGWHLLLRTAFDHFRRSLHRNAVTIAALVAAVAMLTGVETMIHAFRQTVSAWVYRTLQADVYLTPAANAITGGGALLDPAVQPFATGLDGVQQVATYREVETLVDGDIELLALAGGDRLPMLRFKSGGPREVLLKPNGVLVSEPLASRRGWKTGQTLAVQTPEGPREFVLGGIYEDFTKDRGYLMMGHEAWVAVGGDPRIQSLALDLDETGNAEEITEALRERFSPGGELMFYSNAALRARVFEIFDQTFAVTYILRSVTVVVAVMGILLGFTTIVLERSREIGMLRSLGVSRGQTATLIMVETGLTGATATALGLGAGLVLALVLTGVINKAFFGWSIAFEVPWIRLALTPLWMIPVSILAGLWPAWQASRVAIAEAVRNE